MRLFIGMILVMTATIHGAAAQSQERFCDKADSSAAMMECVKSHHEAASAALNAAYDQLSASLDGEDLKTLEALQADWIKYRTNECAWERGRVKTEALTRVYQLSCEAKMSQHRTELLQSNFANQSLEKQVEFSGFPRWMNALSQDYADVFWRVGGRKRVDLDCDGSDEIVMTGTALANNKAVKLDISTQSEARENNVKTYDPFAMDGVIAVLDNADVTGRPDAQIFRIALGQNGQGAYACTPGLEVIEHHNEISVEPGEGEKPSCNAKVQIKDKDCPNLTLLWDGKDYKLQSESMNDSATAEQEGQL